MKNKILYILVLMFLLNGCSIIETSEATHILNGQIYPSTDIQVIQVFLEPPRKEYIVVGLLESRGMGFTTESKDLELSMRALKQEAAEIGAHALIIKSSQQKLVSGDGSTERRISASAIRFK
jgi:hypothetical protein